MKQVVIYPGEDGYWIAECPSPPGCISQGKSKGEAIANIKEAFQGYIIALRNNLSQEKAVIVFTLVLKGLLIAIYNFTIHTVQNSGSMEAKQ